MMTIILSLLFTSFTYASGVDYQNFRKKALECLKGMEPAKCIEIYLDKDFVVKYRYFEFTNSSEVAQLIGKLDKTKKNHGPADTDSYLMINELTTCMERKPSFTADDTIKVLGHFEQQICTFKKQKDGKWVLSSSIQEHFLSFVDEKGNKKVYPYDEFTGKIKMTTITPPYPTKLKLACSNEWRLPTNPNEKKEMTIDESNKVNNWLTQARIDEGDGETTWEIKSPKLKPGATNVACTIRDGKEFWAQRFFTIIYEPNLRKNRD